MRKSDAITYFGSQKKLADALRISQPSVSEWPDLIPKARALELEKITNGELRCDLSVYQPEGRSQ